MKRRDLFKYAAGIAAVTAAPKLLAAPKAEPVSTRIRDYIREIVSYSIYDDAYIIRFDIKFASGEQLYTTDMMHCMHGPTSGRHYRMMLDAIRLAHYDLLAGYVAEFHRKRLAPKMPLPDGYTPPTWWRA